ncbi:hypothetical protein C9374_009504 [Naegleria lovaniensis]|uniref:Uncharacterized protein n=1 Tax=Naegleria lovaniensis TaxID=51637 RepID=A0AA88H4S9_NAELO|nr:uncharacterized protein C9374_009504 [Naegleria lovaniensis]KAG2392927.1 hypothetical protein C9374_009504 [Naegleria lovaniensis]
MGGDQKYNTILRSYFREARAYFYCFDLGDHSSFENTLSKFEDWKSQYEIANVYDVLESTDACLILLGLKADLPHQVDREEVYEFLEKIIPSSDTKYLHTCRVQYFELSSKRDSYQDLILPFIYGCSVLGKLVP